MVGPSSSHTAGACRIGFLASKIFGKTPSKVNILLHGSFAETYRGHGTDKAIVAGLLGFPPDDERIRQSHSLAEELGLRYSFKSKDLGADYHSNSVLLELFSESGNKSDNLSIIGSSIGGGNVIIKEINGLEAGFNGDLPTLICINNDVVGVIAKLTEIIADFEMNIANMHVSRDLQKKTALCWIEVNSTIPDNLIMKLEKMKDIILVRALNV